MNHIFKTVFNAAIGAWVAVPEFAKGYISGGRSARVRAAAVEDRAPKLARVGLLAALITLSCGSAYALPTGGTFVAGTGSFDSTSTPGTLNITATSSGTGNDLAVGGTTNTAAVINWGSPGSGGFNIAAGETVNFIRNGQPVSAWINIDQSGNVSTLDGALNAVNMAGGANGDRPVLLINPNGMSIGAGAVLDPGFIGVAGDYNTSTGEVTLNNAPIAVDHAYVIQDYGTAIVHSTYSTSPDTLQATINTPDVNGVSANSLPFSVGGAEVHLNANASPTSTANLDVSNGSNTNLVISGPLNPNGPTQVNLKFPGFDDLGGSGVANTGAINLSDANVADTTTLIGGSSSNPVSISGGINNQNTYVGVVSGDFSMTGDFAISNDASGSSGSNIQAGNIDLVGANITDSTTNGFSLQGTGAAGVVSVDASSTINQTATGGVSLYGGNVTLDGKISSSGSSGNYTPGVNVFGDSVSINGTIDSLNASPSSVSGGVVIKGGNISVTGTIHDEGVATDGSGTVGNGVAINNSGGYASSNIDIAGTVSSGSSVNIDSYGNATIEQGASISGGTGVSIATDTNNGHSSGGLLSIDGSITSNTSSAGYANTNQGMSIGAGIALTGDNSNPGQSVNIGPNAVITNNGIGGVLIQDLNGNGDVSVSGTINNVGNSVDPVDAVLITGNNIDMNQASITTNGDTIGVQANTAITDVGSTLTSLNSATSSGFIPETNCSDGCSTMNVSVPSGINLMAGSDTFNATIGSSGANLTGSDSNTISLDGTVIDAVGTQDGGLTTSHVGLYADDGITAGHPAPGQYVNITGENNTVATAGSVDLEGTLTSTGAFGSGNGNTIIGATGVSIDSMVMQSQALVTGGDGALIQGGTVHVGQHGTVQSNGMNGVVLQALGNPADVGYGGYASFNDGQTTSYGDGSIDIAGNLYSAAADGGGIKANADTTLTQETGSTIENTSIDPSGNGYGVVMSGPTSASINGYIHNTDQNNNIFVSGNLINIGSAAHVQGVDGIISVEATNGLAWQTGNKETSTGGVQINPNTTATGTPNSDNTVTTGVPSTSSIQIMSYGGSANVTGWLDAGSNTPAPTPVITQLFIDPVNGSSVYGQIPVLGYQLVDANGNPYSFTDGTSISGSASYLNAPTAQSNVGSYSYSYNGGLSLTGTNASEYTIAGFATPSTWQITPATLTIGGLNASNKVYDGNTSAAISGGVLSGIVNGDSVGSLSTGTFATKNVGTGIDVSVDTTITGAGAGNYVLANPSSVVKADITPKPITEVATANNKVYDGNTSATVSSITSSGIVAGDSVSFGYQNANFDTPDVGNGKTVTVSGITASGADAGNYLVTPVETTTADITAATSAPAGDLDATPAAVARTPAVVVPVNIQITTSNQANGNKESSNPAAISMSGNTVYVHTGSETSTSPITVDSSLGAGSPEPAAVVTPSDNSIVTAPAPAGESTGDSNGQNWIK